MSDFVLAARDLVVSRRDSGGEFVLGVDSLDIARGEVLAVLGPNGAGKSTLLRALAGLEHLDRGCVEHAGAGQVAMVFQRPIVFDGSVAHNLRAAFLGGDLSRTEVRGRTEEALARFGIEHMAGRRAGSLSGGEVRRLSLARAFALRPAVLLLDEPFDDLDADAQEKLSLDLQRAIADTDVAVAVVTHDLRRALLLADRIAVLWDGRLVQCDTRDTVLRRPADAAVARLVGMSNLIAAEVARDGRSVLIPGAGELAIASGADHSPGSSVWAGIRPEHLVFDGTSPAAVSLGDAEVRTILSDGVTAILTLDWWGVELRAHALAGREGIRGLARGDRVALSLRPQDVYLMRRDPEDRKSGAPATAPAS